MKKLLIILLFVSAATKGQIILVPDRGQSGVIRSKPNRGLSNTIGLGGVPSEQAAAYIFNGSGVSNGAYSANSLSADFDNAAGSASSGFITSTSDAAFLLKTKTSTRDQEVKVRSGRGTVFLRLTTADRAFYFTYDISTNYISFGIANSVSSTANYTVPDASGAMYATSSASSIITGFTAGASTDTLVFGCVGFDFYIKFNGVEYFRYKTTYHIKPGKAAIKSNTGVSFFKVTHFSRSTLYSNTDALVFDARDFGLKEGTTTGTITGGSNQLTLTALAGLAVNDYIIIPTGYEATFNGRAGGARGTPGVGGNSINLSYANLTAMQADVSQANNTNGWIRDTGEAYYFTTADNTWHISPYGYYNAYNEPKALVAKITGIAGLVLTLDTTANVTATSAPVYFDNRYVLSKMLVEPLNDHYLDTYPSITDRDMSAVETAGVIVTAPNGNYAVGGEILFGRDNTTFRGAGADLTRFFSPDGARCFSVHALTAHNSISEDFQCEGNARLTGYGGIYYQNRDMEFPKGYLFTGANNVIARNLKFKDIFWSATGCDEFSDNAYRYNIQITATAPIMQYIQWHFQDADSDGGIFENCTYTSPYIGKAFEAFQSIGTQFINCHATNGLWACNNASDFVLQDCSQTFTADSRPTSINVLEPVLNINSNQGVGSSIGTVNNHTILFEDYVDVSNNVLKGIAIQSDNTGITVTGGSYTAPDFLSPATVGPQGIIAEGTNITINGFTVVGSQVSGLGFYKSNISVLDGAVLNCVAEYFHVRAAVTYTNNTGTKVVIP